MPTAEQIPILGDGIGEKGYRHHSRDTVRRRLASRLSARLLQYSVQTNDNAPTEIDSGGLYEHHQPDEYIDDPY